MTVTQAPTPGPLSEESAGPYSCIRCDNSTWNDDDICDQCAAEACAPENAIDWPDAPTAPVEASGSERDDPDFWCRLMGEALDALDIIASDEPWSDGATSAVFAEKASATIRAKYSDLSSESHDERRGGYDRSDVRYGLQLIADEECDEVAAAYYAKKALAALRPQPSGETREAVALQVFADEVAKTGVTEDTSGDDAYNALTVIVEYARQLSSERPDSEETDGDLNGHLFRDPIQAAEALLSARPLALGGQQGDRRFSIKDIRAAGYDVRSDVEGWKVFDREGRPISDAMTRSEAMLHAERLVDEASQ